ncbi:hypothetical protein KC678_03500, partial [Candidatus Dojkabacteria bacterium]|nr:hypothetical protein [Candidatus Dojkabacteria bacterium]
VKKNNIWQFKSDWWHSYKITSTGYSLEVSKELEKKPEPVTKITSNYGATTVGNNYGYYRGHDAYYKVQKNFDKKVLDKKTKINLGWIANKEKAPKEVRGSLIKLSYAIDDTADNKSGFYYIVAYTIPNPESITPVQKDRVVIYPSTYGEFLYWKQRLDYGSKEALYKLRARLRVQKSSSGLFVEYCISAENVILNNSKLDEDQYSIPFDDDEEDENNVTKIYPGPDGKLLTEKDWYKAASTITFSGCCSNCDSWLEPKDAEEIYWDQHLAICPRCLEDPYIEDFLQMRTRKAKGA